MNDLITELEIGPESKHTWIIVIFFKKYVILMQNHPNKYDV